MYGVADSLIYASVLSDANDTIASWWPLLVAVWGVSKVIRRGAGVRWNKSVIHVMQPQLDAILSELRTNGGTSLRDAIGRIEAKVAEADRRLTVLDQTLQEHVRAVASGSNA
ncbi:MAG: hypothetical protein ACKVWR_00080 [Acidimicrobiales bacterium]